MAQLHIDRFFNVEPEKVWNFLNDFEAKDNKEIKVKILDRGDETNHQAGLIRELEIKGKKIRERILKVIPVETIEYQLISGAPVTDYFGLINLLPEKDGTTVRWIVTFKPKFPWPEWLIKKVARKNINMILDEIEKALKE